MNIFHLKTLVVITTMYNWSTNLAGVLPVHGVDGGARVHVHQVVVVVAGHHAPAHRAHPRLVELHGVDAARVHHGAGAGVRGVRGVGGPPGYLDQISTRGWHSRELTLTHRWLHTGELVLVTRGTAVDWCCLQPSPPRTTHRTTQPAGRPAAARCLAAARHVTRPAQPSPAQPSPASQFRYVWWRGLVRAVSWRRTNQAAPSPVPHPIGRQPGARSCPAARPGPVSPPISAP